MKNSFLITTLFRLAAILTAASSMSNRQIAHRYSAFNEIKTEKSRKCSHWRSWNQLQDFPFKLISSANCAGAAVDLCSYYTGYSTVLHKSVISVFFIQPINNFQCIQVFSCTLQESESQIHWLSPKTGAGMIHYDATHQTRQVLNNVLTVSFTLRLPLRLSALTAFQRCWKTTRRAHCAI